MRRVWTIIVAVENQLSIAYSESVSSLRYPASNAHAPYCHLWPALLCDIFPHYLVNGLIYKKKLLNIKLCFDFLYNFCLTHFSFQEKMSDRWSKMYWSSCKVPINSYQILMKLEFSWQVFEKYSNIKFHEYPSSGSWVVPFSKIERHDKANSNCPTLRTHLKTHISKDESFSVSMRKVVKAQPTMVGWLRL